MKVLQYEIDEPHANRHFGFFRYADQTETRVRKIVYRGDWPKQLPSLADQESAYPSTGPFSARSNSGSEILTFDLNRSHEELKNDGFSILGPVDQIKTSKTGLRLALKNSDAYETWPGLSLGKSIEGDFEVTVDFKELKTESFQEGWGIGFDLQAELDDQTGSSVAIGVHANKEGKLFAKAQLSHDLPSGKRGYDEVRMDQKTDSGKLRLVRRRKEIHCLFAGADSDFTLIESFIVGEGVVNELRIMSKSSDKNAKLDVTVDEFSLTTFEK